MIKKILNSASDLTRLASSNPLLGELGDSFRKLFFGGLSEGGHDNVGVLIVGGIAFDEELQEGFDFQQLVAGRGRAVRHKNSLYAAWF